jgi:HPt (histidine-containing phosphotransfer) domain-containing protein
VLEQLRAAVGGETGGMGAELVRLFLSEAPAGVEALRRSAVAGDRDGLHAAALDVKGMCDLVGATPLAELCVEVVDATTEAGRLAAAHAARAELERVARALDGLRSARVAV